MTEADVKERYPGAETFSFGDSPALSAELIALVRSGKKTATCGALRDYGPGGDAMPVVGRRDIALAFDGVPALVIETVEVTVTRFCDVSEDFALAEGENDDLAGWRRDHQAFFERTGGFDPEMELVCERFWLIEDLQASVPIQGEVRSAVACGPDVLARLKVSRPEKIFPEPLSATLIHVDAGDIAEGDLVSIGGHRVEVLATGFGGPLLSGARRTTALVSALPLQTAIDLMPDPHTGRVGAPVTPWEET